MTKPNKSQSTQKTKVTQAKRRDFIKKGSSGLLAGAIATAFPSYAISALKNKKVGVALVGLGHYSEHLLAPALQQTKHCELRGIVTGSPSKVPKWQQRYQIPDTNVYSYENMHTIANNPDIDVVYVVVPTALHLKYAEIGANAGKHVWCEKPMAMTVEQCQRMIDTCNKNKVQLTVGYRMQHEPNTRKFRQYAVNKKFGEVKSAFARAGYAGNGFPEDNWRMKKAMGGGAMYDMGVYPVNGVRFLTNMEPVSILASLDKSHPHIFKEVDETMNFTLGFANGVTADCATSTVISYNTIEVTSQNGSYSLTPMSEYSGVKGKTSDGEILPAIKGMQQTLQMDNDALAILNKGPILVSGEDGMRDINIVQSAFKSAASGKLVML